MARQIIEIRKPELFSFGQCLWFLDRRLDDCTHEVRNDSVRKLIRTAAGKALLEIRENGNFLQIEVLAGESLDVEAEAFVTEWFDLKRELAPFYALLQSDPDLSPLLALKGLRVVGIPDFFEAVSWGIIGQQINLSFAYKMKRRLTEMYGEHLVFEGKKYYLFPDPEVIQHVNIYVFRSMQFSGRKAEYLTGIARLFASGALSKSAVAALGDERRMLDALTSVRGIGAWTAHYALLKGLHTMNSIPYGDTGMDTALLRLKGIPRVQNREAVKRFFEKFEGWKSYLVFYLWQSLRLPESEK